jgi:cysteate synthase
VSVDFSLESQTMAFRHYSLSCSSCNTFIEDDGYVLNCSKCQTSSLLISKYTNNTFTISPTEDGIYRYREWLPIWRTMRGAACTVTFRSESISRLTGLRNLWIAFNGYWPEKEAFFHTCSFKELEAYCVLGRIPAGGSKVLTIASAGNTAAAFAQICSLNNVPCLIIIPEDALCKMRFSTTIAPCVKLVAITGSGDYSDAIKIAECVTTNDGFFPEGGAKNVARRDGLGSVLLSVYETIGRLPDYYFQAIGSGTGAIAVHDTAKRLLGEHGAIPHLYLSQNLPFAPIHKSWRSGSRSWIAQDEKEAKREITQIQAPVLANRNPPYSIRGGLYDALSESQGDVFAVTNGEAFAAARLFEEKEKIDLEPAAAVAFASLLTATKTGLIPKEATVVLNITGGGNLRHASDFQLHQYQAHLSMSVDKIGTGVDLQEILQLYS